MDYIPVYAVDKARIISLVPEKVRIKIRNRAKERNMSLSKYVAVMLFADTMNDPWTDADEAERVAAIEENKRKREIASARRKAVKA